MAAIPQSTPQFTGGGTVFGRNSAQWNQYFSAKVDAENGTADNLNLTGSPTINGFLLAPGSINIGNENTSFTVDPTVSTYFIDSTDGPINVTMPPDPTQGTRIAFVDVSGAAATNAISFIGNGKPMLGEDNLPNFINTANGFCEFQYSGAVWAAV